MNRELDKLLAIDVDAELARRKHLNFIQYCWQKTDNFIVGRHTKAICERIDKAIIDYKQGKSTFLVVTVPFRHGKSEIISNYLPSHYLGMFPENEVIVSSRTQDLSNSFSRLSRNIFKSEQFKELYPDVELSADSQSVTTWDTNKGGSTRWVGVGGGVTGKGFHLGIVDDYLKDRRDAESQTIRESQWEWFTNVFLTRRAPVTITIVLATPWHTDDIIGRIKKRIAIDPDFPRFEFIKFSAKTNEGYLFPERFSEQWYREQFASLGSYASAGLLQCEPVSRGGNLLKVNNVKIIGEDELPEGLRWIRGWDLASSEKSRLKNDPDYTVGVLLSVKKILNPVINDYIKHIYIKHVVRLRSEAPDRNERIKQTAIMDGDGVKIAIEVVAGYKDTYTIMQDILKGYRIVDPVNVSRDKISRAAGLEPIFEAGNVYLVYGEWNQLFLDEIERFPGGEHDDQVDGTICAYEACDDNDEVVFDDEVVKSNFDYVNSVQRVF